MASTPLTDLQTALGASLEEVDGVPVPRVYTAVEDEVEAARGAVALVDLSHRGRLRIEGADRIEFLQGQCTGGVKGLEPGQGVYTTFLTGKGKMRGDGWVWREVDRLRVSTSGAALATVVAHLESFVIMEDVRLVDEGAESVELGLIGPGTAAHLDAVGLAMPAAGRAVRSQHGGEPIVVAAEDRLGVPGVTLTVARAHAVDLWQAILRGATPIGRRAAEVLRVEAGLPSWGAELDEETIPIEAGLEGAIDYGKGCFTGYEVLARIRTYGHVNRHLRGLVLDAEEAAASGAAIRGDGKVVGRVGTSVRSERIGAAIALALVRREVAEPGTRLSIEHGDGEVAARVAELPFDGRD